MAYVDGRAGLVRWVLLSALCTGCNSTLDLASDGDGGQPPIAVAGEPRDVPVGRPVAADGVGSADPEGDALSFRWSLDTVPEGSALGAADVTGANTETPTFTPDVEGTYYLGLVVGDGVHDSDADYLVISAGGPRALPGDDVEVVAGDSVTLDGSGSELHGGGSDGLSHAWVFLNVPPDSALTDDDLSGADAAEVTFTPDAIGVFTLQLVVDDGALSSRAISVNVTVTNTAPVAHAGDDQIVETGATVTLDASASLDAEGHALGYRWTFTTVGAGSEVSDADLGDDPMPTFVADHAGTYRLMLVVHDGYEESSADSVIIAAGVPLADPGPDRIDAVGEPAVLGGASRGFTGEPLGYRWTLVDKPAGSALTDADISFADAEQASITPDVIGDYTLRLVVTDTGIDSAAADVVITASVRLDDIVFDDPDLADCVTGRGERYVVELTTLHCSGTAVDALGGIEALTELTVLELHSHKVVDVSPLAALPQLQELYMSRNPVADIAPLSMVTQLRVLNLAYTGRVDLSALSALTQLQELHLMGNSIVDVAPLSSLVNLADLSLGDNAIVDISPLSSLMSLTRLGLGQNAITDLTPLSGLTSLQSLWLDHNGLDDIAPLSTLVALETLWLNSNQLSDLSALSALVLLRRLELGYNLIDDVSALSALVAIETLSLAGNTVADVSSLAGMLDMLDLDLQDNPVDDVSSLSGMAALVELNLYGCDVADLSPLSGLLVLRTVDLSGNRVSDLSPLSSLNALLTLSLINNQITDLSPLSPLDLVQLYLGGNAISDITPLSGMTTLANLALNDNVIRDVTGLAPLVGMQRLWLDNNLITDGVAELVSMSTAVAITLGGNLQIPCADLGILTAALPGVATEPQSCVP